ncbi:MAG TPA: glycosyltransferase family 39 protein [Elusimicrobiota bacterium]|nr:glycosyltransferase family 39 protein [Elusimicrobiota bacterium]
MTSSLRRRARLAAAVCALSLAVHAKGLRAPLLDYHYHRQVNTAAIARNYWREDRPLLRPRIDWAGPEDRLAATELPVEMWLHGKLWPLFGLGEAWGRVLSVAASALTALLLFLLFERELGTEAGFYGAALFTVLPVEIYFGRTVQPEAAALLFFVCALYFWDRALQPGRSWSAWLAATLSAFLSIGLKLPYAHVFIPLAALSWRRLGRAAWKDARTWAAGLVATGGVLAWYVYASRGVYVVPTHANEFAILLGYREMPHFFTFLVLSRFPELIATYAGLVFFFLGAREILLRRRDAFFLAWLGGSFVHLLALGKYGQVHEYTCLPLAAGVAGVMGEGLRILFEKARAAAPEKRAWAAAGVALLVAAVPVHAALRIGHWYRQGFEYAARAGEAAAAVSRPGDLFLTNSMAPSMLLYYLDRRGWSEEFSTWPGDPDAMIEGYRRQGARFIASEKKGAFAEPDGLMWRKFRAQGAPLWDDGSLVIFPLAPKKEGSGFDLLTYSQNGRQTE